MRTFGVLVVTGDASLRAMLCRSVSAQPALRIAGCGCNAPEAERLAGQAGPDVIALDMQLPDTDCAALIPRLRAACGSAVVAMSALTGIALPTLNAGATDFVYIPERGSNSDYSRFLADAVDRLKIAAARRQVLLDEAAARAHSVAAVACSLGGPVPLACLVSRLPAGGPAVLAVQWQAVAFCPDFCSRLSGMAGRPVQKGEDGMRLKPGGVVVVTGSWRAKVISAGGNPVLRLDGSCLSRDEQAEALFESLAAYDGAVSGALLYDSAAGEGALKRLAARGMPAVKLNKNSILRDIDYKPDGGIVELPLEDIASAILS